MSGIGNDIFDFAARSLKNGAHIIDRILDQQLVVVAVAEGDLGSRQAEAIFLGAAQCNSVAFIRQHLANERDATVVVVVERDAAESFAPYRTVLGLGNALDEFQRARAMGM